MNLDEQPLDFQFEIQSIPWVLEQINHLQDPSIYLEISEHKISGKSYNDISIHSSSNHFFNQANIFVPRRPQASYEIGKKCEIKNNNQNMSDEENSSQNPQIEQKSSKANKSGGKQTKSRRNQISRKYRERRKQYIQNLEEQNKFLKFKVDELQFRLHELQIQLNRLKINTTQTNQSLPNYHTIKSQSLQQLQNILANNPSNQECLKILQKLNSVVAFDGKQKIDLLNYFMSELMENVISDKVFYFTDSLIRKKGFHRADESIPLSKLDQEVFQILKADQKLIKCFIKQSQWSLVEKQGIRFQELWKKLYQVYLAILNQGFRIEGMLRPLKKRMQSFVNVVDMLRLQLHFEKNKYRNDIREMRNLWFKDLQRENMLKQQSKS